MENQNLYQLFQSRFPTDLNRLFLKCPDGREVTYGQLEHQTAQFSGALKALGIKRGDRVLVQVKKSVEAVVLYLACLRSGSVYVPLNTAYTASEVAGFANDAEPALLICDPSAVAQLQVELADQAGQLLTLDTAANGSFMTHCKNAEPDTSVAPIEEQDLAAIIYTSGTTGRSKGAMLSHGNLAANGLVLHKAWGWQPGDVLLHALPVFHAHGLFVALNCSLLNGGTVLFLPRFDLALILSLMPEATLFMGVPTFYTRLLDHPDFSRETCRNIRLFICGSAPLQEHTFSKFEELTGHRILERYGMTEAGLVTSNPLQGERVAGTVGFALPNVKVRIADENGQALPAGQVGILELKSHGLFKGYWRMPNQSQKDFRADGYFISGDLAKMDTEGRFTIVGRARDLVISGGYNVYPKEIETCIDSIEGVKESAVIGLPHSDLGEAVVAVIVTRPGVTLDEITICDALQGKLARFKQPKRIFFRASLPRNAMGKVLKNQLREEHYLL